MTDYSQTWSMLSDSGNRSNAFMYLRRKASETHNDLQDYCDYTSESVVDLGCGAGELLEHLATMINIVKATDYSERMLSAARVRLANAELHSIPEIICAGIDILPDLVEEYWISTGALSQYSSQDQLELIMSSFKKNKDAKHFILFDTIDPVRYFILPLISYGNCFDDSANAFEPKRRHDSKRLFDRGIASLKSILKVILASTYRIFYYRLKILLVLLLSPKVCRLPGPLMGYGVSPSFWGCAAKKFGLEISLISSREFEYRYHVIISK